MNKNNEKRPVPVSRYEILGELGRGGSSIVYLVSDRENGSRYAMKVLKDTCSGDRQLHSEAMLLESIGGGHPGIPSFAGEVCGEDSVSSGFLMEYVEGRSVQQLLDEGKIFSVREAAEAGLQLCSILGYLHSREPPLIYRDLKPANILIRPEGGFVIVDYGAAREYRPEAQRDTRRLGTEGYAAPEQYGGWEQSDARTDIYGIGAVLHHMLTGCPPLESGLAPLEEYVQSGRIHTQTGNSGKTPRQYSEMGKILRRCCYAARSMRFSSCKELERALRGVIRICEKEKNAAAGSGKRSRVHAERTWRRLELLAAAALLFLVCSGMLWTFSLGAAEAGYRLLIREAAETADLQGKAQAYKKAVSTRPGDPEAYICFLRDLTGDSLLTEEEKRAYENTVYGCGYPDCMREKRPSAYAELEMETGKLLFACYEGGTGAADRAFRNALDAAGFWFSGRKTAEAMGIILAQEWTAERAGAWQTLEREAVREAMRNGDGVYAAAVCRSAAGDMALSADRYRMEGIEEAGIGEIIGNASEFWQSAEKGWPVVPERLRKELRTAVESAERNQGGRN